MIYGVAVLLVEIVFCFWDWVGGWLLVAKKRVILVIPLIILSNNKDYGDAESTNWGTLLEYIKQWGYYSQGIGSNGKFVEQHGYLIQISLRWTGGISSLTVSMLSKNILEQ